MLAATVIAGLCFGKMMHSALAICFVSFLSILDLWYCIQFLKRLHQDSEHVSGRCS